MKIVIHGGINKTGTSSIQTYLYKNKEVLRQNGIVYPDYHTQYCAHHRIAFAIKSGRPHDFGLPANWLEEVNALAEGAHTLLLSSEAFHLVDPREICKYFPAEKTKVVFYLREHVAYFASWYQQSIQDTNITTSLKEFVQTSPRAFTPWLRRWYECYGRQSMSLGVYDRAALAGGDVIEDFKNRLDWLDWSGCTPLSAEYNKSLTGNLLFFKKVLNNFLTFEEARSITDEIGAMANYSEAFGGRMNVEETVVNFIATRFADDRSALKNEFGLSLIPHRGVYRGQISPDFDNLERDWGVIRDVGAQTGKKFSVLAARMPGWNKF